MGAMVGSAGGDLHIDARSVWAPALGVAVLVAVALTGVSVRQSLDRGPVARLRPIDEVVRTSQPLPAFAAIEHARLPHVERAALFASAPAFVKAADGRNDADAHVVTYGAAPVGRGALVTSDLARRLHVYEGDRIVVDTGTRAGSVRVTGIEPARGLAGFALDASAPGANVVVSPDAFTAMGARGTTVITITNKGGVRATDAVIAELQRVHVAGGLTVDPVGRDLRSDARADARAVFQPVATAGLVVVAVWVVSLALVFARRRPDRDDTIVGAAAGAVLGVPLAMPLVRALHVPLTLSSSGAFVAVALALVAGACVIGAVWLAVTRVRRAAVAATCTIARAALCMVMFALAFAAFGVAPLANARQPAYGDWDVIGRAPPARALPRERIATILGEDALAPLSMTTVRAGTDDGSTFVLAPLTAFDGALLGRQPPTLLRRGTFEDDESAYESVLDGRGLVIASDALFERVPGRAPHRVRPGDHLRIGGKRVTVVATTSITAVPFGVLTSAATARSLAGDLPRANAFLLGVGADNADAAASDVNAALWETGVHAQTVAAFVRAGSHRLAAPAHAVEIVELTGVVMAIGGLLVASRRPVRDAVVASGTGVAVAAVVATVTRAAVRPDLPWRWPHVPRAGLLVGAVAVALVATLAMRERQSSMRFADAMPPSHDADGFGVRTNVARSTATSPNFGS